MNDVERSLVALDDRGFGRVVDEDLRGRTDDQVSEALRSAALRFRWIGELHRIRRTIRSTLRARAAESAAEHAEALLVADADLALEAEAAFGRWASAAERVARRVEELLEQEAEWVPDEAEELREAIRRHRDHVCSAGCNLECEGDLKLWTLVEDE